MKKNERQSNDKNESFKTKIEVRKKNSSKGNHELNNRQKERNQLELMFRLYKDREKKREQEVKGKKRFNKVGKKQMAQ